MTLQSYMESYATGLDCARTSDCTATTFWFLPNITVIDLCRKSCDACSYFKLEGSTGCAFDESTIINYYMSTHTNFRKLDTLITKQRWCMDPANSPCSTATDGCANQSLWSCPFVCG